MSEIGGDSVVEKPTEQRRIVAGHPPGAEDYCEQPEQGCRA
jgi:hypothetical protein